MREPLAPGVPQLSHMPATLTSGPIAVVKKLAPSLGQHRTAGRPRSGRPATADRSAAHGRLCRQRRSSNTRPPPLSAQTSATAVLKNRSFKKNHQHVWYVQVSCQRSAGGTKRAPHALLTLVLDSARACQVNCLGARAQSCICWTSETGAAAGAREPILEICW